MQHQLLCDLSGLFYLYCMKNSFKFLYYSIINQLQTQHRWFLCWLNTTSVFTCTINVGQIPLFKTGCASSITSIRVLAYDALHHKTLFVDIVRPFNDTTSDSQSPEPKNSQSEVVSINRIKCARDSFRLILQQG